MNAPRNGTSETAALNRAHERLKCLYEISKRLARFESIARTVPEVLALISESVPVRTAILIFEEPGAPTLARTRAIAWHTEEVSAPRLRAAKAHARQTYAYLARRASDVEEEAGRHRLPSSSPPPPEPERSGFLLLPLVVDQGQIFGALQIEAAAGLDEADLMFINAMVVQLAIALDRIALIESKQAADKAGRVAAEFLSDASVTLFSSFEYETTIAAVVRAAAPPFADICFIDEVREDGRLHRTALALVDPGKQDLADQLRHFAPATDSEAPQAEVLRTGKSVLLEDLETLSHDETRAKFLDGLGVQSIMTVPLHVRGRTLGALTFVSAKGGHRYSESDLRLAEEIGRRAAIAMNNAHLYEQAQRATQARENLLAIVSHDLRNPLSAIFLSTSNLLRTEERMDSRKELERIQRSAERMNRLIGDLLNVASIEAGQLTVDTKSCPVDPMVEETVGAHQAKARAKGLRLEREVPGALVAVECDRERILEVFGNLLDNAIKFTPEGGSIKVGAEKRGEQMLFSVADNGSGIGADELSHVFDRFWQAKKTARLGTGLGLSIAKGLVEANGGKLWVESQIGVGSTFFFTLSTSPDSGPRSYVKSEADAKQDRQRVPIGAGEVPVVPNSEHEDG